MKCLDPDATDRQIHLIHNPALQEPAMKGGNSPMQDEIKSIPKGWKVVPLGFFQRPAPIVAAELLTCVLLRKTKTGWIGGPICETEAYTEDDPASHTFRGKTEKNASMFGTPGTIYIYRSYGIHWCATD